MGFPRQEWSGLPFPSPGDLPHPGIKPASPHCRWILYYWATREALQMCVYTNTFIIIILWWFFLVYEAHSSTGSHLLIRDPQCRILITSVPISQMRTVSLWGQIREPCRVALVGPCASAPRQRHSGTERQPEYCSQVPARAEFDLCWGMWSSPNSQKGAEAGIQEPELPSLHPGRWRPPWNPTRRVPPGARTGGRGWRAPWLTGSSAPPQARQGQRAARGSVIGLGALVWESKALGMLPGPPLNRETEQHVYFPWASISSAASPLHLTICMLSNVLLASWNHGHWTPGLYKKKPWGRDCRSYFKETFRPVREMLGLHFAKIQNSSDFSIPRGEIHRI